MNPLLLKLIIDGTSTGAIRALVGVSSEAKKTGADLAALDKAAGGFGTTQAGLAQLESQLRSIQVLGSQVFAFAGVSLGVASIIGLADAYQNMTGRLRLATQYTGNFNEVFGLLRESATSTRSSLQATVDLYAKMAPALAGVGLQGKAAVAVITTINQAIALSGASSQAAEAALIQLGQGFGSGVLRGEELNSVMEQTPGLAQAIADGLGVSVGALRQMGAEGQLTAEKVAGALQKVREQVEADFQKLPVTVSQALQELQNSLLVFIGQSDAAVNGTSTLAAVILEVSTAFKEGAPPVVAFTETLKVMVNGLDGAYRMLKIVGTGLAAYAAMATAAAKGDFSGARDIWQQLGKDIDAILQKPLLPGRSVEKSAERVAARRESLEAQLADQVARLEKLKAYEAGTALDNIAAKEKENIDKRIADQQRLVDAVRTAWQASLAEAKTAASQAQALMDKATAKRGATQDKVFNAQTKGLAPEEQALFAANRANEMYSQGSYYAAAAGAARLDGRFKQAEQYQKQAEQYLQRAETFADKTDDAGLMEKIGNAQAALLESQAKHKQSEADKLQQQAEAQAKTLNDLQAQLTALQAAARAIEVKADVQDAVTKISGLKSQIDALPSEKTITLKVVQEGNVSVPAGATAPVPARAFGGPLPGMAPHDRADNMLYWGTPGEWVIQRPAVRYYGAGVIAAINAMRFPKFAYGGGLGMAGRLQVPQIRNVAGNQGGGDVLDLGALGSIRIRQTPDTRSDAVAVLRRAAQMYGRK